MLRRRAYHVPDGRGLPSLLLVTREALAGDPKLFLRGRDECPQLLREAPADDLGRGVSLRSQSIFEVGNRFADARFRKLERTLQRRDVVVHMAQYTRVRGRRRAVHKAASLND